MRSCMISSERCSIEDNPIVQRTAFASVVLAAMIGCSGEGGKSDSERNASGDVGIEVVNVALDDGAHGTTAKILIVRGLQIEHGSLRSMPAAADITRIKLLGCVVNTDAFVHWNGKERIEEITIISSKILARAYEGLKGWSQLRSFYVQGESFDDKAIESISELSTIKELHFVNTSITDAGLSFISRMRGLATVSIVGSRISSEGVRGVEIALLEAEKLTLDSSNSDDSIGKTLRKCKHLKSLTLAGRNRLTDRILPALDSLTQITFIGLSGGNFTKSEVDVFRSRHPKTAVLYK